MASCVEDTRSLGGGLSAGVSPPTRDARLSARLVAKAAATFGLPNLLQQKQKQHASRTNTTTTTTATATRQREYERRRGVECVLWKSESCCSCTPLACLTSDSEKSRRESQEESTSPRGPSPTSAVLQPSPATLTSECRPLEKEARTEDALDGGKHISTYSCLSSCCDRTPPEGATIIDSGARTNESGDFIISGLKDYEQDGETEMRCEENEGLSLNTSLEEEAVLENTAHREETERVRDEKPSEQEGRGGVVESKATKATRSRRQWIADYEKEWTFRPQLNHASLRIVSQTGRGSLPVALRLYEKRTVQSSHQLREDFTFAPKLNAASLRLAQERAERLPEVHARMTELAAQRLAEACANYTFHPNLSRRSLRLARHMEADFKARQQQHLLRQRRKIEETQGSNFKNYCKRSRPITLPTPCPSSTPPPRTTTTTTTGTPSPQTHPHTSSSSSSEGHRGGRLLYRKSMHPPSPSSSSASSPPSSNGKTRQSPCKTPQHQQRKTDSKRPSSTPSPARRRLSYTAPLSPSKTEPPTTAGNTTVSLLLQCPWNKLSNTDKVKRVKLQAERAIKSKKVFVCRGGYNTIRSCLRERGWVEKDYTGKETDSPYTAKMPVIRRRVKSVTGGRGRSRDSGHAPSDNSDSSDDGGGRDGEEKEDNMNEEEYHMLCRAVRNAEPNFVWTLRRDDSLYSHLLPSTPANHFAKASSFTTKVGLCTNLRGLVWCGETSSDLFFPRCFLLSSHEEKDLFIDDYHFTAALNMLKLVTDQYWGEYKSPNNTFSTPQSQKSISRPPTSDLSRPPSNIEPPCPPGERVVVSEGAVELALRACEAYVSFREHEDIEEGRKCLQLTKSEWNSLLHHYHQIVLEGGRFECSTGTVRRASAMLDELEKYLPQLHMNGTRNIWIVKPGAMSRGRGIVCLERLEPILDLVSSPVHKEGRWVVQKYVERPLLIHGTKFDIRQWFLITDWAPLTMWMYQDCYLRFATQRFTLDNMNESIHLCNNSIQRNYVNSGSRSELLPDENMWSCSTFKDYLQTLGQCRVWDEVVYPGMKHALTCAMKVSQDLVEARKNSFELYGADFMLTDDFKPWLIEINCSPTMEASTSVTSQLCAEVMEDTIKVVLDRREDKECSTGKFELAYKQPKFDTPAYVGIQLCVEGVAIQRNHTHSHHSPAVPVATLSYNN